MTKRHCCAHTYDTQLCTRLYGVRARVYGVSMYVLHSLAPAHPTYVRASALASELNPVPLAVLISTAK